MRKSIAILILASAAAPAEDLWDFLPELPPTSEISFNTGGDSNAGWNARLSASISGPKAIQFTGAVAANETISEQARLQTRSWSAGISSDPLQTSSIGINYEEWGKKNALTIDTLEIPITWNLPAISLMLTPQQRKIYLQLKKPTAQGKEELQVDSQGIGLDINWYINSEWSASAGYRHYNYSKNPTRLATDYRAIIAFSPDTLQLASGLDQRQLNLGMSWSQAGTLVGIDWLRATSAIDQSRISTTTLYVSRNFSHNWRIDISGGMQNVPYEDSTLIFGNLGMAYEW